MAEVELVAQNFALRSHIQILQYDFQHLEWVQRMAGKHTQKPECGVVPWYEKQEEEVVDGRVLVLEKVVQHLGCA